MVEFHGCLLSSKSIKDTYLSCKLDKQHFCSLVRIDGLDIMRGKRVYNCVGFHAWWIGSKLAKRKHQIGTLYHEMKMNELKNLDTKSQGIRTKHETEAKYGWR